MGKWLGIHSSPSLSARTRAALTLVPTHCETRRRTHPLARVLFLGLSGAFLPLIASAHEVYVLDTATITRAMSMTSPNPFTAIIGNEFEFLFWGFVSFVVFSTVITASFFHVLEKRLDPMLFAMKRYALPVARITTGLCVIAFAYAGNIYGSELFLSSFFGSMTTLFQYALGVVGILLTVGLFTRPVSYALLALYAYSAFTLGIYAFTYTDFLGAFALTAILGGGIWSLDSMRSVRAPGFIHTLQPYAFPFLRICLGWGVLFASIYAKYMYSQLALEVVIQHDLVRFFPFDPLFIVLGALIIEFIIGLMLIFGVAIRWTLLFLAFWLTLSLLYFQELIWPHGILFGLAITLFLHGYDRYSLEGYFFKKHGREPVL